MLHTRSFKFSRMAKRSNASERYRYCNHMYLTSRNVCQLPIVKDFWYSEGVSACRWVKKALGTSLRQPDLNRCCSSAAFHMHVMERDTPYIACSPKASPLNIPSSAPDLLCLTKNFVPLSVVYTDAEDHDELLTWFRLTTLPLSRFCSIQPSMLQIADPNKASIYSLPALCICRLVSTTTNGMRVARCILMPDAQRGHIVHLNHDMPIVKL